MAGKGCFGDHRLHVADVAIVPAEGKVCILSICLNCGEGFKNEHVVAKPLSDISMLSQKEK